MITVLWDALLISLLIQSIFFAFAAILKTDKFTDLSYGMTFLILAVYFFIIESAKTRFQFILMLMVVVWAIRIAGYLFYRIQKMGKDTRFDEIRVNFVKFLGFWTLQGVTVWVVMIPYMVAMVNGGVGEFGVVGIVGYMMWMAGFVVETVADWQKFVFKSNTKNKDKWIDTGLWKYSRHPNYFGEILVWWGIFVMIAPILEGVYWLSMVGPGFITLMLLFVSGIPPLEKRYAKKYEGNKKYQNYKESTSRLVLWPPMVQ